MNNKNIQLLKYLPRLIYDNKKTFLIQQNKILST